MKGWVNERTRSEELGSEGACNKGIDSEEVG